jgi:hypothetical protein
LVSRGAIQAGAVDRIALELRSECMEALDCARKAPYPPVSNLLGLVYSGHAR